MKIVFILSGIFFSNVLLYSQLGGGGPGDSKDNAYQIWTREHLLEFSDSMVTKWDIDKHFRLMQDINNVSQTTGVLRDISGSFNGSNKEIKVTIIFDPYGIYPISAAVFRGLNGGVIDGLVVDGYINESIAGISGGGVGETINSINNINLTNPYLYVNGTGGIYQANNGGTISHCLNNGRVSGVDYIGGIAAVNVGTISNCINTGKITGTEFTAGGYNGVGGIVAASGNTISNCINLGDITGINYISGIAGSVLGGFYSLSSITNCFNSGYIKGNKYIGGIVGFINDYGNITNCINTGVVEGEEDVGSIVGKE